MDAPSKFCYDALRLPNGTITIRRQIFIKLLLSHFNFQLSPCSVSFQRLFVRTITFNACLIVKFGAATLIHHPTAGLLFCQKPNSDPGAVQMSRTSYGPVVCEPCHLCSSTLYRCLAPDDSIARYHLKVVSIQGTYKECRNEYIQNQKNWMYESR